MDIETLQPVTVYGFSASYFTGKLENYLRLKGIPYTMQPMRLPADEKWIKRDLGVWQMPVMRIGDGRLLTDTTKIIEWLEEQLPQPAILPGDPAQRFLCLLIEDYADEWLWRPAMHFRWYYPQGAALLSYHIAEEVLDQPLPAFISRWMVRRRQRGGYTMGDGITRTNVDQVEALYLNTLDHLQAIFSNRPFVLGDRPSLADVGLSGPFFRHFGFDPVPLEIMRQRAPAVFEWMARLWNSRLEDCAGKWCEGIPEDLTPLLTDIGEHYLEYLCANVEAVRENRKTFDATIAGVPYRGARWSRYRVWCLQELRDHYSTLPKEAKTQTRALLEKTQCWEPLWREQDLPLLPDQEAGLPFHANTKMVGTNE